MPPVSQAQRKLFWKAKNDPKFRKAKGLPKKVVDEMTSSDPGGKLPNKSPRGEKWYGKKD